METDKTSIEILQLLEKIDMQAAAIYSLFAETEEIPDLKQYWKQMSKEEKNHVEAWRFFSGLISKGEMKHLFDSPEETLGLLQSAIPDILAFASESKTSLDLARKFNIACELELFMLNSAFLNAFYILQSITNTADIDSYERHLANFIDKLNEYGCVSQLKGLISIIKRLWSDNKKLVVLTNEDFLTRLMNRRGFKRAAIPLSYMSSRNHHTVAILMLDLDHFKKINDTYGHLKGDEILYETASLIKSSVRRSDLVGRYGGEEFIVFLPQIEESSVFDVSEKIRKRIEEKYDDKLSITISIGAVYAKYTNDIEEEINILINEADKELYKAKTMGRNRVSVKEIQFT